jgi:hypothetical protein
MASASDNFARGSSMNLPKVDDEMISMYMRTDSNFNQIEKRNVKTARSGRSGYGDDAIGYVGVKRVGNICYVKAEITSEHNIRNSR